MHETRVIYLDVLPPLSPLTHVCITHMRRAQLYGYIFEDTGRNREKEGAQDKRRSRDCNENAIICSQTDIIPLGGSAMRRRRLKDSPRPALHMDLIDHSHSSGDSTEILRVNYNVTAFDVFLLKPSVHSIA